MDLLLNLRPEPAEYDLMTRLLGCVVPKVTVLTSPPVCSVSATLGRADLAGEQQKRK